MTDIINVDQDGREEAAG